MADKRIITWENFVEIHYRQLLSIGLPESLWKTLYTKLVPHEVRDAGTVFDLHKDEKQFTLHSKVSIEKEKDVYLVDHAWTSDGAEKAKKTLLKRPELLKRMKEMMCLDDHEESEDDMETIPQEEIVQCIAGIDEEQAKECLNKMKNDLIQATILAEGGDKQQPDLNLDELDDPKVLTYEDFKDGFMASVDEEAKKSLSEEFLEKIYKKYLKDSEDTKTEVRYGEATTPKYSWNETDEGDGSITVLVSVPSDTNKKAIQSKITPKHWTLGVKDGQTIIDGDFYSRVQPDDCFWTFDGPGVLQMTLQKTDSSEGLWPCLIREEVHLNAQQIHDEAIEKKHKQREEINLVLESMWKYNQTYQAVMVKGGPQEHMWYIMDEVGSALTHSSNPNMKCSPFAYAVNSVIYSLIWPIQDIEKGDVCTRNFCPSLPAADVMQNNARLLTCMPELPDEYPRSFLTDYAIATSTGHATTKIKAKIEPLVTEESKTPLSRLSLKFYVDSKNDHIKSVLSSLHCSFTDKPEDAAAIWVDKPLSTVDGSKLVNFLSGDDFLTRRDVLSRMMMKKMGKLSWYPQSFNLRSQLAAFCVEHYMKGVSALWIIRSANPNEFHFRPVISSDLRRIIRLVETGPLVASEFIITSALTHKKHFVLQYAVIIQSLKPLELLIHNTPNIRKTPKPYETLAPLDEYQPEVFITMKDNIKQEEEPFQEFVQNFEKHYTVRCQQPWAQIQKTIFTNILELFSAVSTSLSVPGMAVAGQTQQKLSAVYGVDVIVQEDISIAIIGVDAVPTFANEQVTKEVLYLMYADKDNYTNAGSNVTKVTCDE